MRVERNSSTPISVTETQNGNVITTYGGGSNIDYFSRADITVNAKDKFGFRSPSDYSWRETFIQQPSGQSDFSNPGVPGYEQSASGYPAGIQYWHGSTTTMTSKYTQSEGLLAQRAEANLDAGNINVLQTLAFLPATLRSISNAAKNIGDVSDLFAHREFKHIWSRLKMHGDFDPRSLYLQYLFVVNQAVRDISGASELLLQGLARPELKLIKGTSQNDGSETLTSTALPSGNFRIGRSECTSTVSVQQRAVSYARVTHSATDLQRSLGILNPLYLGWDMVKWSWVIDQVVDVGSFIGSLDVTAGLEFLGTSVTTVVKNESQVNIYPYVDKSGWQSKPRFSPGISRQTTGKRTVSSSPNHGIHLRNPYKNNALVTAAVVAAASMSFQRALPKLGKLRKSF